MEEFEKEQKPKLPKILLAARIIGLLIIAGGLVLLILGLTAKVPDMGADGWFDSQSSKMGLIFGGGVMLMFGIVAVFSSFASKIHKAGLQTTRYIIEDNKEEIKGLSKTGVSLTKDIVDDHKDDLKDIAGDTSEIIGESIKNISKSFRDGLKGDGKQQNGSMFCKHCGKKIDSDSKYCSHCGKQQ